MSQHRNIRRAQVERLMVLVANVRSVIAAKHSEAIKALPYTRGWLDAKGGVAAYMAQLDCVEKTLAKLARQGRTGNSRHLYARILYAFKPVIDAVRHGPPQVIGYDRGGEAMRLYAMGWYDAKEQIWLVVQGAHDELHRLEAQRSTKRWARE